MYRIKTDDAFAEKTQTRKNFEFIDYWTGFWTRTIIKRYSVYYYRNRILYN